MSENVVVEANATVRFANVNGKLVDKTGVFAVRRDLIAPSLKALPEYRLKVLDRDPSEGEIQKSREQGLIGEAPEGDDEGDDGADDRPLDQLLKADLEAAASLLGLDATGTKADIHDRIVAEGERLEVDLTGPGLEVAQRIHDAQQGAEG